MERRTWSQSRNPHHGSHDHEFCPRAVVHWAMRRRPLCNTVGLGIEGHNTMGDSGMGGDKQGGPESSVEVPVSGME